MFYLPEKHRRSHPMLGHGTNDSGYFVIPVTRGDERTELTVLASGGLGWEHVSVSTPTRCPTWDEMCLIKSLFWDEEDAVMQLHPPGSKYVNCHPFCLHLWRPTDGEIPLPDSLLVGPKLDPTRFGQSLPEKTI